MLVKFRWIVECNRFHTNSRPTKTDKNSEELLAADRHIEKFKDVLEKIGRKFIVNPSSNIDQDALDKRCKKVHEFKLAQAMEESLTILPDGLLHDVLRKCGKSICCVCVCGLYDL